MFLRNYEPLHQSGAGVGLDVTPARFIDPVIRDALDPVTNIPGYLLLYCALLLL